MAEFSTTYTVHCPDCNSGKIVKVGRRNGYQRYLCRDCEKKFRADGTPEGRQIPAEQIGMAVRMFYSGMSYKQIAESMADAFDIPEPAKSAIYYWVVEYTDNATKALNQPQYKATTGPVWVADELQVKVGGGKYWLWNVMDAKTRFILASHLSRHRNMKAAETVMEKAEAAAEHPKIIKTDRLASYPAAISLVFPETKHVQSDGIRAEVNNNLSERLQGTYRQRIKTLRGLDSLESGQRYLDGWTLTYNFFREHESIDDRTPGEAAKVDSPYKEWADVVREDGGVVEAVPRIQKGAVAPKVQKPRIVPMVEAPVAPPSLRTQSTPPLRAKPQGPRRPSPQHTPRVFKSASGRGRPSKPRNPAWLRRGEVRGKY